MFSHSSYKFAARWLSAVSVSILTMAAAQAQTAAQLQLLESLPESQRQALITQYSQSGHTAGTDSKFERVPDSVEPEVRETKRITRNSELQPYGYDLFRGRPTTFALSLIHI